MITRIPSPAGRLLLLLALLGARPALAQWTTQSFTLQEGWNAIYTHVAASPHLTLRQLIEADAANPIDQVWLWKPAPSGQQFTTSPAEPVPTSTQWRQWKLGASDIVDNTLNSLPANSAFLVHLPPATTYTWRVVGKPVPPRYQWTTSGLNFIGFPTPDSAPPTFQAFLAAQPALRNSAEVFQYSGSQAPSQVFAFASTPVRRGEAFWVRSGDFFNRYFGPFEVLLQNSDGVHFGESGGQYRIRLRNLSPSPIQVVTSYANGDAVVPPSEEPIEGLAPLLVRGARSMVDLTYGFQPLTGSVTNVLQPNGREGFEAEIVLGVDRSQLTGEPGRLFAGILTLRDLGGLSLVQLPVSARPASMGGLWVGSALVTQVRHYLQAPVRGPDGQSASDASPLVLQNEVTNLTFWAGALNAPATPLAEWLAGQLSSSTRQELAFYAATSFAPESLPSSKFSGGDIADLPALLERLQSQASGDPFRVWLTNQWSASTHAMVIRYGSSTVDPRNLRAALVDTLNGLVVGPAIYDEAVFAEVVLSPDTLALQGLNPLPGDATLARLNRRLLDDALSPVVTSTVEGLRRSLTADVNRLVYGPLIYRPERFAGILLSSDALKLVDEKPQGDALAYLNRMLLEEAFPGGLLKNERQHRLRPSDFRSLESVVQKLLGRQAGDLYSYLWDQDLAAETKTGIEAYGTQNPDPNLIQQLVTDLTDNTILGPSIYSETRFANIPLSTETQSLRLRNPTGEDLVKLNRMLLEDAFPGAIAPSYGRILVTTPREDFGSVARPFPLRLIVHSNPDQGSGGASLLQRVYVGTNLAGTTIVATRESLLAPKQATARRISAPQLPWSDGNNPWTFDGVLDRGRVLKARVTLGHENQAANPFLHTYHPDHDNRNALFDEELPRGEESYGIVREITLTVSEPPTDFDARTVGDQTLSGAYAEVLQVQGKQHPAGGRPDEIRRFEVRGAFSLNRVMSNSVLTTP